jgi:VWFA-related protein
LTDKNCKLAPLFAVLLLTSWAVYGQSSAQDGSTQPSNMVIKKTIRLIEVEVIAKDKKGNPVTDLEAKDFSLSDNGRAQKVILFSIEKRGNLAEPKAVDKPEDPPNAAQPHVFSNNHAAGRAPVVILMDLLNTAWDNQPAMKTAIVAAAKRIPPGTPVALLILQDDLKLVSDFTTDAASLAAALDKPSAATQQGSGPTITAPKSPNKKANEIILKNAVRAFNQETGDREDRTIRALTLIRSQLTLMRGRKSLIWICGGLLVNPHDWPAVKKLIEQMNNANVAVYTVDARGVMLDYGIGADVDANDMLGPWVEEQEANRGDILDVIAHSTGGVPYRNTNALDQAITRAMDDNSTVYTLGYYPQHDDWQGKPHKIEVKVARSGINLRYRSGYVAAPEAKVEPATQQRTLEEIAASPLEFPGLKFSVEAMPGKEAGTESFRLNVPATELGLLLQEDKYVGALQLSYLQREASGKDVSHKPVSFSFHLTNQEYQTALTQGLTVSSVVNLEKNVVKVRVLLHDVSSGRVGTVDVPVISTTTSEGNPKSESAVDSD